MTLSPQIQPGRWTVKFMMDIDRDSAVNITELARRINSSILIPNTAVIGNARVEVLQHRGVVPWVISGVVDIECAAVIPADLLGTQILAAASAVAPNANARAYRDLSIVAAAPAAAPLMIPFLAPAALLAGAVRAVSPNTANRIAERTFPTKVVTEVLPYRMGVQPDASTSVVGTVASAATRRVSEDRMRDGVVGATAVGDAARQVNEATRLSTGATIAIVAVSVAVTGVAVYFIARKVL